MRLPFTTVLVTLACVTEIAVAGNAASPTPTRRLEGYRRFLPFWSPRPRRRALSPATPAPTTPAASRKRDGGTPASTSTAAGGTSAPQAPSVAVISRIFEPSPVDIETETPGGSFSRPGPNNSPAPTSADLFEIVEPFGPGKSFTGPVTVFSTATGISTTVTGTPGPSPSGLTDPASDSVWEDAANHGCRLVDAMRVSNHDAGQLYSPTKDSVQSTLMSYEDFTSWGWSANLIDGGNFTDIDGGQKKPDPGWGIGHALRDLHLSDKIKTQGGKNVVIDAIHGKEPFTQGYTKVGKNYPATGAEFKMCVNTDEGVLMAVDRVSPASAAKKRNPPVSNDQLPDVHTFADVGYLNYKKVLGKDPTSLKYMMSLMITNEKTASIITKALGGENLGPWPGKSFDWRSKEFKALLGSPNGMGFGYLLVQHKSQLGSMFIKTIQVFHGDTWHHLPNMVFALEEQNSQEPPPKSSGSPPQMVEPMVTGMPSKLRRGEGQTKIHFQGAKNFVRAHIKHVEL